MWFRVDDQLWKHPKAHAAGHAAIGAWTMLGSLAAELGQDGLVPGQMARAIANRVQLKRLVDVGLLERDGDSYRFHDWDEIYRPMPDAERQRRYRGRKASREPSHPVTRKVTKRVPTTNDQRPVLAPDDDDDRPAVPPKPSSSSRTVTDQVIAVAAQALGLQQQDTRSRYVQGIAKNLRTERISDINAALERESDPVRAAGIVVGSHVLAREAARAISTTNTRTNAHTTKAPR